MKEWQRHGEDTWVYGECVRGVVREVDAIIEACRLSERPDWYWLVYGEDEARYEYGFSDLLQEAFDEVEKRLGISDPENQMSEVSLEGFEDKTSAGIQEKSVERRHARDSEEVRHVE